MRAGLLIAACEQINHSSLRIDDTCLVMWIDVRCILEPAVDASVPVEPLYVVVWCLYQHESNRRQVEH